MIPQTHYEQLESRPSPATVVGAFTERPGASVLESAHGAVGYGRYTIVADDPVADVRVMPGDAVDAIDTLRGASAGLCGVCWNPARLPEASASAGDDDRSLGASAARGRLPSCGWIGYLAYEATLGPGHTSAARRRHCPSLSAHFRFHDSMAVFDRIDGEWYLGAVDWPASSPLGKARPPAGERIDRLRRELTALNADTDMASAFPLRSCVKWNMSFEEYVARVARAKEHIAAGDVYQINLTQRFSVTTALAPREAYLRLRSHSPPAHGAFLNFGDYAILSSSPELFLRLEGEEVITRPIKGTRPRSGRTAVDMAMRRELRESAKERAELVMIVDLMRNDLGRVCRFGSVAVHEAAEIEEHATVLHQVATIGGRLREGLDWSDLLKATFPPGSVTGAPKIRAMEIIDALEPTPRGVYCGAIGRIGLDGGVQFNVAIRTLVHRAGRYEGYAGGAIVADSVADEEYAEVMTKSRAMLAALGSDAGVDHRVEDAVVVSV